MYLLNMCLYFKDIGKKLNALENGNIDKLDVYQTNYNVTMRLCMYTCMHIVHVHVLLCHMHVHVNVKW